MNKVQPTSEQNRLIWLTTALQEATRDAGEGRNWLIGATRNQLSSQLTRYQTLVDQHTQLYEARRGAVANRVAATEDLKRHVRMAYKSLKSMAVAGTLQPTQLDQFKIPSEKRFPEPKSYAGWLGAAENLVRGNTRSAELGWPAIPLPTPEVLQAKVDAVLAAREAVASAKAAIKDNQLDRKAEAFSIHDLWKSVGRKLNDALAHLSGSERREIMRRYGFIYTGIATQTSENGSPVSGSEGQTDDAGNGDDGTTTGTTGSTDGQSNGDTSDQGETEATGQTTPSSP